MIFHKESSIGHILTRVLFWKADFWVALFFHTRNKNLPDIPRKKPVHASILPECTSRDNIAEEATRQNPIRKERETGLYRLDGRPSGKKIRQKPPEMSNLPILFVTLRNMSGLEDCPFPVAQNPKPASKPDIPGKDNN